MVFNYGGYVKRAALAAFIAGSARNAIIHLSAQSSFP